MKKTNITCPYCGAPAVYRPAGAVYKNNTKQKGSHLYVCSHWPACDSYVAAHRHNGEPMGTLANKTLRRKRILAHKALNQLRVATHMSKWAVYIWMQMRLQLSPQEAHIGMFTEEMCDRLISLCEEAIHSNRIRAA